MTTTTNTTPAADTGNDVDAGTVDTARPAGVLEHIDPAALSIEENVRSAAVLEAEFIDSVATHGVLVPILAWRDSDGVTHVRAGQRRTLAAREAGLATVPVYVVQAGQDDAARRIVEQLVENDHRQALTATDRLTAWRQLQFEGLTVAAIAKRTSTGRDQVTAGLAVAGSAAATALLDEGVLTLDQAAALIEFEDDPDLLAELTATAEADPDYLPVAMQRARNERTTRAAVAEVQEAEATRGRRVLDTVPRWGEAPYAVTLLRTADGEPVEDEAVQDAPGLAVHVSARWDGEVVRRYFLDDPEAAGLVRPATPTYTPEPQRQAGPMTEEQKAERRTLIARNKEWDAATTVRQEWLAQFLGRKTLPKDAARVLAVSLTAGHALVAESMGRGSDTAKTLLGVGTGFATSLARYLDQHPGRAMHVALAVALGGIEQTLSRTTWRNPSTTTAAYLTALAGWGYPLCPVERIAALIDTDDAVDADADTDNSDADPDEDPGE